MGITASMTAAIFIGCPSKNRLSPLPEYAASFSNSMERRNSCRGHLALLFIYMIAEKKSFQ